MALTIIALVLFLGQVAAWLVLPGTKPATKDHKTQESLPVGSISQTA